MKELKITQGLTRRVDPSNIRQILRHAFGNECSIQVSQREYLLLDFTTVHEFVKADHTDRLLNRRDHFDLARILVGRALENVLRSSPDPLGIALGEVRGKIAVKKGDKAVDKSVVVLIHVHKASHRVLLLDPENDTFYHPNARSEYECVYI